MNPKFVMLAGPNGAGKTTFYEAYLSNLDLPFLNADELAKALSVDAYSAAREIAALRDLFLKTRCSFIMETIFSDPVGEKVAILEQAVLSGYEVDLIYIGLEDVSVSIQRAQDRVAAGGHDVPLEKLENRYSRSLLNLKRAIQRLPRVLIYDNSDPHIPHRFLVEYRDGSCVRRSDFWPKWLSDIC